MKQRGWEPDETNEGFLQIGFRYGGRRQTPVDSRPEVELTPGALQSHMLVCSVRHGLRYEGHVSLVAVIMDRLLVSHCAMPHHVK